MSEPQQSSPSHIKYQVDESPPFLLTVGMGVQLAILSIAGIILTPAIVIRAGNASEEFLTWAIFVAILVCGVTTIIQAIRIGRIGAGYVLLMGTSGVFIAVSIMALQQSGPATLCTLVVISSIFQFLLANHLSMFRRVFNPIVSGTVIMLISVTVMPIVFDMLVVESETVSIAETAWVALTTIAVIVVIALKGRGALRLWAPVIGVVAGSIVALILGLFDMQRVSDASLIGIPEFAWPGLDVSFGPSFWVLLPSFILVTLVGAIETIGDSIAIQRVSWRQERAVDYRVVQGAVNADGVGNLLSGLGGTVPNTTYSSSVSITELTGVASRRVGVAIGVTFLVLAFFPKLTELIVAIPGPVVAAYLLVVLSILFVVGMRIALKDGVDFRKCLIIGVSFWIGVGCQNQVVFPELLSGFAGGILNNGMTAGGLTAILLSLLSMLSESRRKRISLPFSVEALTSIQDFLNDFVKRKKWEAGMSNRLHGAAEESLYAILNNSNVSDQQESAQSLQMVAYCAEDSVILELQTAPSDKNLQDQIALLKEHSYATDSEDLSLRLLRKFASSIRHQQYYETQLLTLRFDPPF